MNAVSIKMTYIYKHRIPQSLLQSLSKSLPQSLPQSSAEASRHCNVGNILSRCATIRCAAAPRCTGTDIHSSAVDTTQQNLSGANE